MRQKTLDVYFLVLMAVRTLFRSRLFCALVAGTVCLTGCMCMAVCIREGHDVIFNAILLAGISAFMAILLLFISIWYRSHARMLESKDISARHVDDSLFWDPTTTSKPDSICLICLVADGEVPHLWGEAVCCGTSYHKECLRAHFRHQDKVSCPICRNV